MPLIPLLLVIVSGVVYHLSQKAAGTDASPWPVLATAYGVALFACLFFGYFSEGGMRLPERGARTASLGLGLAVLGIEAGFFLVYKAGWPISSASLVTNICVTLVLATFGLLVSGEAMSGVRAVGLVMAAGSLALIVRG